MRNTPGEQSLQQHEPVTVKKSKQIFTCLQWGWQQWPRTPRNPYQSMCTSSSVPVSTLQRCNEIKFRHVPYVPYCHTATVIGIFNMGIYRRLISWWPFLTVEQKRNFDPHTQTIYLYSLLRFVIQISPIYTLENWHGIQKWRLGRWLSFSTG